MPIETTEFGIFTDVRAVQPKKASLLIVVTEFGIIADVKLLQSSKALSPIAVTELGIVSDTKFVQPLKALSPIDMTEFGIIIDVIPIQSENAPFWIDVIFAPISIVLIELLQPSRFICVAVLGQINTSSAISLKKFTPTIFCCVLVPVQYSIPPSMILASDKSRYLSLYIRLIVRMSVPFMSPHIFKVSISSMLLIPI